MPKGPADETKLRTGEPATLAEGAKRFPAASDGPRPHDDVPFARAPMQPAARRRGPGGLILAGLVLVAAGVAVWYFFLRQP